MMGIAGCGADEGTAAALPERGTVTITDQAGRPGRRP